MATQNSTYRLEHGRIGSKLQPAPISSTRETAQYIADMILELRNLAKAAQLKSVQGLLEVTYYEAFSMAHKVEVPAGEVERLDEIGMDARRAQGGV